MKKGLLWDIVIDTKKVFTGTDKQIAEHFGLGSKFRGNLYWQRNYRIAKKYHVLPHVKEREKYPSDPIYDYALKMIKQNHNAFVMNEPDRIAKKLADDGIDVEIRNTSDRKGFVLWEI